MSSGRGRIVDIPSAGVLFLGLVGIAAGYLLNKASSPTAQAPVASRSDVPFEARYSQISNGIVKKNATGEMLTRLPIAYRKTHSQAIEVCRELTLGGYSDWELPTNDHMLQMAGAASDLGMSFVDFFGGPDICGSHRSASKIWIRDSKDGWGLSFECQSGRLQAAVPPAFLGAVICYRTKNVTAEPIRSSVTKPPPPVTKAAEPIKPSVTKPTPPVTGHVERTTGGIEEALKKAQQNEQSENVPASKVHTQRQNIQEGCLIVRSGQVECF